MNEITKIHLGRQAYTIAADAYKALQTYLHDIKREVGESGQEVADEVEARMAELLTERGITTDKVVLLSDVDYLKEQLGSPRDFKGDEDDANAKTGASDAERAPKRLFRDTEHGMLGGVCAGLARYVGIDVTIVRLIFIALIFFGGGGVLLYAVLWLVVPEVRTTSDRLQMQGKPVNVDTLKEIVDRADFPGAAERAGRYVAPAAKMIARIFLTVCGAAFIAIAAALLLGVAAAGTYAWANHGVTLAHQSFFPVGIKETAVLLSGLACVAIVAFFFLLGGITMVKPRWKTPGWLTAALGGMFILAAGCGTALAFAVAPQIRDRYEALHHTAVITVKPFHKVSLNGFGVNYSFQPDDEYKVEYRYLGTNTKVVGIKEVKDDTLTIDGDILKGDKDCDFLCIDDGDRNVIIHAPSLNSVELRGEMTSFRNDGALNTTDFTLNAEHDNTIDLQYVNPGKLEFTSNPDRTQVTVALTGLKPDAFRQDAVSGFGGRLSVSRAAEVVFNTDAHCDPGYAMLNLTSFPNKLVVNGRPFTTPGDLHALRNETQPFVYNCIDVAPVN